MTTINRKIAREIWIFVRAAFSLRLGVVAGAGYARDKFRQIKILFPVIRPFVCRLVGERVPSDKRCRKWSFAVNSTVLSRNSKLETGSLLYTALATRLFAMSSVNPAVFT